MTVMTLNTRSMMITKRQQRVLQYLKDKKPAIAMITETWLTEKLAFKVKGAKIA